MAMKGYNRRARNAAAETEELFEGRHKVLKEALGCLTLEQQMNQFLKVVTMENEDYNFRLKVLDDLKSVLTPTYPNVRLFPFGSLISGLGEKDSDLDVFVDCVGDALERKKSMSKERKSKIFYNVLKILRANWRLGTLLFRMVVPIAHARVPIIKFIHDETGIHCDVSFENMLSIRNSKLVQFMVELDPRVRPLICLIRYWGKFYQLTDSLKIKNYALNLLVIVFLTRKRILPSVYRLQHWDPEPPDVRIDFWNASFYENIAEVQKFLEEQGRPPVDLNELNQPTTLSIIQLAMEFFKFYKDFSASTHVICTLTAEFIPRLLFYPGHEKDLPNELSDYKVFCDQPQIDTEFRRLETSPRMSWIIQDPFALNFNVGAVTRDNILCRFFRACKISATHFSAFIDSSSSKTLNLMDIFCDIDFMDIPLNQKDRKAFRAQQELQNIVAKLDDKKNKKAKNPRIEMTKSMAIQQQSEQIPQPDESVSNFGISAANTRIEDKAIQAPGLQIPIPEEPTKTVGRGRGRGRGRILPTSTAVRVEPYTVPAPVPVQHPPTVLGPPIPSAPVPPFGFEKQPFGIGRGRGRGRGFVREQAQQLPPPSVQMF